MQEYFKTFYKKEVYPDMLKYAIDNHVPIIMRDSLELIKLLIEARLNKKSEFNILEIGTAIGYSSLHFKSVSPLVFVDTIERNQDMIEKAKAFLTEYDSANQVRLLEGDALTLDLKLLKNNYDLLFIDAAKAQNQRFFERFSAFLDDDGIIITDNLYFHGCMENIDEQSKNVRHLVTKIDAYNNYLHNNEAYLTTFIPIGDGIAVTRKRK